MGGLFFIAFQFAENLIFKAFGGTPVKTEQSLTAAARTAVNTGGAGKIIKDNSQRRP